MAPPPPPASIKCSLLLANLNDYDECDDYDYDDDDDEVENDVADNGNVDGTEVDGRYDYDYNDIVMTTYRHHNIMQIATRATVLKFNHSTALSNAIRNNTVKNIHVQYCVV